MRIGNKSYKQILIDSDNYYALKEIGKTGDSFNFIIGKLLQNFKQGESINCPN